MKPSRVSAELRRIASGIEKCKKPRPDLVGRDLCVVLAALEGKARTEVVVEEDEDGEEAGGLVTVMLPDGGTVEGSYRVEGGKGRGMELDGAPEGMSDEEALGILDEAQRLYWEEGLEEVDAGRLLSGEPGSDVMEIVHFGVSHPEDMSPSDALEAAKDLLEEAGYRTGGVDWHDVVSPGELAANIEVGADFTADLKRRRVLEFERGGVKVTAEWP